MKIIVQAGGKGSRMKSLTKNKPKALVPISNKPILFHLFEQADPEDGFIVIGDYKFDILDGYLTTFVKNRQVILIKSCGSGNACGIRDALNFVDPEEPVLLVWCDLILPPNALNQFKKNKFRDKVIVCTSNSQCSWSMSNGKLYKRQENITKIENGVVGIFFFPKAGLLKNVPTDGSFTTWLSQQDFELVNLSIEGCKDLGTKEAYEALESPSIRCRPYNSLSINEDNVIKRGLTDEAVLFLEREVCWYRKMEEYKYRNIPKLLGTNPLTLSHIHGNNLFAADLDVVSKQKAIEKVIHALKKMHNYEKNKADPWDIYQEYFVKTIKRIRSVATAIPFANESEIPINGLLCRNVLSHVDLFRNIVIKNLMSTSFALFHGDCQLTNTLIDSEGEIFFIDPRGYFGKTERAGDVRYDWSKLYFSLSGNFDQFNIKHFDLAIEKDGVGFLINSGGWESLVPFLLNNIPAGEGEEKEIQLIHSIIWLSMASHAWEDFDSMCVAFYNGTLLFENWLRRYYDSSDD